MAVSTFGRAVGVNPDAIYLEDSTKLADTAAANIVSGRPVRLLSTGLKEYTADTQNTRPYGIAKFTKNSFIDETRGAFGAFGGGKGTVIKAGIMSVRPFSFIQSDDTELVVDTYDTAQTYVAGQTLYVELVSATKRGQITNQLVAAGAGQNDLTAFGRVTKIPTTTDSVLEFEALP